MVAHGNYASLIFIWCRRSLDRAARGLMAINDQNGGGYWRQSPDYVRDTWRRRAQIAAGFIPDGSRVLDLGAGEMALRQHLINCHYTPADLIASTPETIAVDLNRGEFPDGQFDAVALLGVIEYLNDPEVVLKRIHATSPRMVTSYAAQWHNRPRSTRLDRLNYLSAVDIVRLLHKTGWSIREWRVLGFTLRRQHIVFSCVRSVERHR